MGLSSRLSTTKADLTMISFRALPSCNTSNTVRAGKTWSWNKEQTHTSFLIHIICSCLFVALSIYSEAALFVPLNQYELPSSRVKAKFCKTVVLNSFFFKTILGVQTILRLPSAQIKFPFIYKINFTQKNPEPFQSFLGPLAVLRPDIENHCCKVQIN